MILDGGLLVQIAAVFTPIGLLAIGGMQTILPELHRQLIENRGWVTDADFTAAFAISQAAPVPNILIVTLLGLRIAGLGGAIVATVASLVPPCVLAYFVGRIWHRFRDAAWRPKVEAGLGPVTVGFITASAILISRSTATSMPMLGLVVVSTVVLLASRVNPLWLFAAGALLGGVGLL